MNAPETPPTFLDDPATSRHLERLRRMTSLLDDKFVDPILGLALPGVGDTVGATLGLYSVYVGHRLGIHPVVLCRMLLNLAVDALLGSIPLLGLVIDFFYRAHRKNLALIDARGQYGRPTSGDWVIVLLALAAFLLVLMLPLLLVATLAWLLWGALGG